MHLLVTSMSQEKIYLFSTHMTRNKEIAIVVVVVVAIVAVAVWLIRRRRTRV